ncbi:response regulator transcription factor [Aurantibacillus circumpalustris]|uniref:response regulator transcription factor n=1 Tax=Aurantibacillus circumpalustris TaxID=3036359 RepID=UPI00295C18D2|nr:response regulator transcription factor [Aurantibacillus circumpalustris]
MSANPSSIIFVDNSINGIFKTLEVLKQNYKNISIFNQEKDFLEFMETNQADVIFLNLDLHPNDAVVLCKEIRQHKFEFNPFIIIYTDKQDDFVQELAFNSGVDSFINFHNKPSVIELFLKNLLRRRVKVKSDHKREVIIDTEQHLVFKNGVAFQLPRKEFKLFELLYNNSEKFFSKTEIASNIWNDEAIANKRTIDVHIYNIRQFFGKRIIQSQKGRGYRINKKLIS